MLGLICAVGGLFYPLPFVWGVWLMGAALALSASEVMIMEMALNETLDRQDSEVESRQHNDQRKAIISSAENQRVDSGTGLRGAMFDPETAAFLTFRCYREAAGK